jgi:hypothetical protein
LAVLVVFAVGSVALVWIGRRQTEAQARLLGRVLGAVTLAIFGVALVYKLIQPAIDHSVPLQLCDLAELTAVYGLWDAAELAQLPLRGHHDPGVGSVYVDLQHNRRQRLRLPQQETRQRLNAGSFGTVADLRTGGNRYRWRSLGAHHLALGA